MDVRVKKGNLDVEMVFGNNGITMEVRDTDGSYLGKLRVGRATLEWCRGKKQIGNGEKKNWKEFIEWMES